MLRVYENVEKTDPEMLGSLIQFLRALFYIVEFSQLAELDEGDAITLHALPGFHIAAAERGIISPMLHWNEPFLLHCLLTHIRSCQECKEWSQKELPQDQEMEEEVKTAVLESASLSEEDELFEHLAFEHPSDEMVAMVCDLQRVQLEVLWEVLMIFKDHLREPKL